MRLSVHHITRYRFDAPVSFGLQQLRKIPKTNDLQQVIAWDTQIEGGIKELSFDDHHNNRTELISFERGTTEVVITSRGEVALSESHGILGRHRGPAPLWVYEAATERTKAGAGVRALLADVGPLGALDSLHALSEAVRARVAYTLGASEPDWSAEAALNAGQGVCQDHAHVFLACARAAGVPARYVSGYLMLDDTTAQDAMHAWVEAHVPDLGWVGFDVSNGISPDTRYVRVATGLDYSDAAPISGTRSSGVGEELSVEIQVAEQQ
ncbi:transglutaminase family protein [Roseobacteraceae bacterium S113]